MNFAEVLVAALLLAGASSGSLQIWAAAVAASRGAELGLEQLVELDGALLAAEQHLQQALGAPLAAPLAGDCSLAVAAMAAELAQAPLAAGLERQLEPQGGGLWLRLQAPGLPQRQRWLDAAAMGFCSNSPTPEAGGDGTPG